MKVLLAGATGTLGVPLVRALLAAGHEVIGISRTPGKRDKLRTLGAEPLVADVMDPNALLGAVDSLKADVVAHKLSALKRPPMRHSGTAATDALRYAGKENVSRASFLAFANGICSTGSGPTADVVFGAGRVATNES
jgi:uncharacterized protein YbjT (DUF2867 family)